VSAEGACRIRTRSVIDPAESSGRRITSPIDDPTQGERTMMKALLTATLFAASLAAFQPAFAERASHRDEPAVLLIADAGDDSVKRFDARTGAYLGTLVQPQSGGLSGPMGLIPRGRSLLVVNQNIGLPFPGEILRYDIRTGETTGAVVPKTDPSAPFAPRGLVRSEANVLHVADMGLQDDNCANEGRIATYDGKTGRFIRDLNRSRFTAEFHPRGLVFGPDRLLYVSAVGCPVPGDDRFNPLTGYVLRFHAGTGEFVDVFASHETVPDLHRPEGLVFDERGNLWVTSFRSSPTDSDRILKLERKTGRQIGQLVLAAPQATGAPRAFAQALVFGPGDDLFVPISGGALAGEVRRCDTQRMRCRTLVPAGGPLQSGWYAVFEDTDSATLAYEND
jgi:hypothetical protein